MTKAQEDKFSTFLKTTDASESISTPFANGYLRKSL